MGGGDLNLKKSWHPQTMANLEQVWLAEQRMEEEERRLDQLKQEIREEREKDEWLKIQEEAGLIKKRTQRLDWMYQGPSNEQQIMGEREAFLLGRKPVEFESANKDPIVMESDLSSKKSEPKRKFGFTGITQDNKNRDLESKLREDPLFAIKMREKVALKEQAKRIEDSQLRSEPRHHRKSDRRRRRRDRNTSISPGTNDEQLFQRRRPRHSHRKRSSSPRRRHSRSESPSYERRYRKRR